MFDAIAIVMFAVSDASQTDIFALAIHPTREFSEPSGFRNKTRIFAVTELWENLKPPQRISSVRADDQHRNAVATGRVIHGRSGQPPPHPKTVLQ